MPLHVDGVRGRAELVLRAIALTALAALLWRALRPTPTTKAEVARGNIVAALERWTASPPSAMQVIFDAAPSETQRAWIRALVRAGTPARWSSTKPIAPAAVTAEPAPEPYGATRVRLASSGGEPVAVGDAAGLIDSLPRGGSTELELTAIAGTVRAASPTFAATTTSRDSILLKPVLVLGTAGWESKFTIAALEERGWRVASRVRVAPKIEVTQGTLGAIDTARYSAVIALDSSAAAWAADIGRYLRAGGGVVLVGATARLDAFAALAPGSVGKRSAGIAGAVASANPRTGLGAFPVTPVRVDAVPLELRNRSVVVAARRVGPGRVIQLGYDETWRWRMAGGDEAATAHREWWSRLVSAVAYAPIVRRASAGDVAIDETPLASLIDALGPPVPLGTGLEAPRDETRLTWWLFAVAIGALLLEWTSRRLRGAP
jgi:hypothetical protein